MNSDARKRWSHMLRLGVFSQVREKLRNTCNGRCCLGVLIDAEGYEWVATKYDGCVIGVPDTGYEEFKSDDYISSGNLPGWMCDAIGLSIEATGRLANANDHEGLTFSQIADFVDYGAIPDSVQPVKVDGEIDYCDGRTPEIRDWVVI